MGYVAGRLLNATEAAAGFFAFFTALFLVASFSARPSDVRLSRSFQLDERYSTSRNIRTTDCADPEVLIVAANWSYDVSWLDEQPFCYVLVQRMMPHSKYNTQWNKGFEHPSYLQFIIDRYDSLPRKIIFLHSHRTSWHQADMVDILWNLQVEQYTFAPLSGIWNTGIDIGNYCSLKGFYKEAGLEKWLAKLPEDNNAIEYMCCSQFIVTRKRIRSQPLALYKALYSWLRDTPLKDDHSSRHLEWAWHMILQEPFKAERPEPSALCAMSEYCPNQVNKGARPFKYLSDFPQAHCSVPFSTMGRSSWLPTESWADNHKSGQENIEPESWAGEGGGESTHEGGSKVEVVEGVKGIATSVISDKEYVQTRNQRQRGAGGRWLGQRRKKEAEDRAATAAIRQAFDLELSKKDSSGR
jgi:hypothetical protein